MKRDDLPIPNNGWVKLVWDDIDTHPTEDHLNDHCTLFFNERTFHYFVGRFDYDVEDIWDDDADEERTVETAFVEIPNTEITYDAESESMLWWSEFSPCQDA